MTGCRWLPLAAAGCRWLPLAAAGCRWLPLAALAVAHPSSLLILCPSCVRRRPQPGASRCSGVVPNITTDRAEEILRLNNVYDWTRAVALGTEAN